MQRRKPVGAIENIMRYHENQTNSLLCIPIFKIIKSDSFLGNEFLVEMYKLQQNYTFKIDTISKIMFI